MADQETKNLTSLISGYRAARRKVTRLLEFPDGIVRHVAMTEAQWKNYDWVLENNVYAEKDLLRHSYEHGVEWAPIMGTEVEFEIRRALGQIINAGVSLEFQEANNTPNDNGLRKISTEEKRE